MQTGFFPEATAVAGQKQLLHKNTGNIPCVSARGGDCKPVFMNFLVFVWFFPGAVTQALVFETLYISLKPCYQLVENCISQNPKNMEASRAGTGSGFKKT